MEETGIEYKGTVTELSQELNTYYFSNIKYFYCGKKLSKLKLKSKIEIDESLFFEGIGLYFGEGQKKKTTNEIALSNTDPGVLRFYLKWLNNLFGINQKMLNFYIYTPDENFDDLELREKWSEILEVDCESINKVYCYKKSTKECVLVVCSRAVLRYLLDEILEYSKSILLEKEIFCKSFIRGILAGEGCVCIDEDKKVHHVQVGMKNPEYIELLVNSLEKIGIDYTIKTREDCIIITISRKYNIEKLVDLGGFGSHRKRNLLLKKALGLFSQRQTKRHGAEKFYLNHIKNNPGCSSSELSKITKRSRVRLQKILKRLNDKNLVQRIKIDDYYIYYKRS